MDVKVLVATFDFLEFMRSKIRLLLVLRTGIVGGSIGDRNFLVYVFLNPLDEIMLSLGGRGDGGAIHDGLFGSPGASSFRVSLFSWRINLIVAILFRAHPPRCLVASLRALLTITFLL